MDLAIIQNLLVVPFLQCPCIVAVVVALAMVEEVVEEEALEENINAKHTIFAPLKIPLFITFFHQASLCRPNF